MTPQTVTGSANEKWVLEWRCRVVRVTTLVLAVGMCVIVVRNSLVSGNVAWCDLTGVFVLTLVAWLTTRRPDWMQPLSWFVLLYIMVDVLDGLLPWKMTPITSTHILLPPLVLYGAILGSLPLSAFTAAWVFMIYGATWWLCSPLSQLDLERLINLIMLTACFCLLAVGVRFQHRRFIGTIRKQAADLQDQLDANQRLNAVITHDISNPLSALRTTVDIAQHEGKADPRDMATIGRMAGRIANILDSVRQLNNNNDHRLELAVVKVGALTAELEDIFAHRLAAKEQRLVASAGGELHVFTDARVVCCSVLGNLLSNAIKFAPRGATLSIAARVENNHVRIELHNPCEGFPPEVLKQVAAGKSPGSRLGTEAETGAGYGLRIARFYLQRMGGQLEVANETGGAVASILLPTSG